MAILYILGAILVGAFGITIIQQADVPWSDGSKPLKPFMIVAGIVFILFAITVTLIALGVIKYY